MSLDALLLESAARAATMSPAARYYWARHAVRFEFALRHLDARDRSLVRTVLDVGSSFQTQLLADCFPEWRIDTLTDVTDDRFRLPPPSRQHLFNLNEVANPGKWPALGTRYDLIVFMEVVEHLTAPPHQVLKFLAAQLEEGGVILLTTPNAAWLKNRLKLLRGRNPFELLREDQCGHIREYTLDELVAAAGRADLATLEARRLGLYAFTGAMDRFYSALADATLPSLRRSIFMVLGRTAGR